MGRVMSCVCSVVAHGRLGSQEAHRKQTMNLGERRPNKWWTETDTFAMLTLIEQLDLVHELDKKRQRNDSHFRRLRHSLAKRHIHFTVNQIRNRWKSLKHKYRKIKTASYRSPAARLSAMESFRYFRMLDRMLANKPRVGPPDEGSAVGHDLVLTPSDLEDHTDSTGDVAQACTAAPWQDPVVPKLEGGEEVKPDPDEAPNLDQADWAVNGTDEVMTLGLSGEYLGSVKAEPIPSSAMHGLEGAREPTSCSSEEFQGTCEDTSSLILQQLTILNHQLSEQLAEQRAFHCSMLGMMDRQIEVLEQLSSFTRSQQEARATMIARAHASATPSTTTTAAAGTSALVPDMSDDWLSRRVQEVLTRMQRRNAAQAPPLETLRTSPTPPTPPEPCLSKPSTSGEPEPARGQPSRTATLPEITIKQEPCSGPAEADAVDSGAGGSIKEALATGTDVDTSGPAKDSQPEGQPSLSSPGEGALVNGLLDS